MSVYHVTQPGGHGTLRKMRNGRAKQKELWRMRSSKYTEHGELGVLSYRREAKLCWCLWANSLFSQMRHTKSFWKCVLASDRIPNPDGPKVKNGIYQLAWERWVWSSTCQTGPRGPNNVVRPQCHHHFLSLLSVMSASLFIGFPHSLRDIYVYIFPGSGPGE